MPITTNFGCSLSWFAVTNNRFQFNCVIRGIPGKGLPTASRLTLNSQIACILTAGCVLVQIIVRKSREQQGANEKSAAERRGDNTENKEGGPDEARNSKDVQ